MTDRPPIPQPILTGRTIAVGCRVPADGVRWFAEAVVVGGVRTVEITVDGPEDQAFASVAELASLAEELDLVPGAGTVRTAAAARRAVEAGARFVVTPHTATEVAAWCASAGVPSIIGAFSPSEVVSAWSAGASAVKLFPAAVVGPSYLAQLRGPFPEVDIIPTGISDPGAVGEWLAAGAKAIGIRSGWLVGDGDPAGITQRARQMSTATSS